MLKIIFSVSAPFQRYFLGIFLIFSLLSYHTKEHFEILFSIFLYFKKNIEILVLFFPLPAYLVLTIKRQVLILCFPIRSLLTLLSL